jgi:hypothetical protein
MNLQDLKNKTPADLILEAGQAVQNMNIRLGLKETLGLE